MSEPHRDAEQRVTATRLVLGEIRGSDARDTGDVEAAAAATLAALTAAGKLGAFADTGRPVIIIIAATSAPTRAERKLRREDRW